MWSVSSEGSLLDLEIVMFLPCPQTVGRESKTASALLPPLGVQVLSHVQLFVTPWMIAHQAPLSLTISQSLLECMSIELVMLSNHFILCRPLILLSSILPSIRIFSKSQFLASGGQSIGAAASASVLPMNIQDWFPLGWTGLISLQSNCLFL